MSAFLLAVRSGFGFLSTIPVGITMEGLDELMKRIASIYYLTGLNHLDGLADFGDGATAHGSLEKKIGALKDMSLGIGGVAYAVIALVALYASITALQNEAAVFTKGVNTTYIVLMTMFVAEVSAKQAMLTIAAFGKPIHEGLGSMAINNTNLTKFTIGLLFGAAACMLAFGIFGILALLASIISALVVLNISNRHFGGVNGDCIGTANEIGRIVALMTIVVLMHIVVTKSGTWSIAWMQL
jgi:adenosylcobinamide-GDP ribazoletransferase